MKRITIVLVFLLKGIFLCTQENPWSGPPVDFRHGKLISRAGLMILTGISTCPGNSKHVKTERQMQDYMVIIWKRIS